ncbi:hypothetical protein, conserved [Trypanosoma cruzi]|uniref:Uncharacterized protein n=1 Tax=Trypanosoma cruzi (strain CL Brener) TaxID=353153 RepID=Q4DUR9_TRYCC|nr:hypothetical protein, conserved [Trypanosoma cruzi]EAN96284.1 hypothetical protein, conserved [Trypanosoma cruzi]|eukprot:XP_818135.1 hypothetical protein [Trypanosoma cruzi strain CL Brener]
MRRTLTQQKAHEPCDGPRGASHGPLKCHGAFRKTGRVAARRFNRGDAKLGPTSDPAGDGARRPVRPSPEKSAVFGEVRNNADPGVVAGRVGVKEATAEGRQPWMRAEGLFKRRKRSALMPLRNARRGGDPPSPSLAPRKIQSYGPARPQCEILKVKAAISDQRLAVVRASRKTTRSFQSVRPWIN